MPHAQPDDAASRLRTIIEHMPVMMDAFDADGTLVAWNRECERVTGYARDEMVGNPGGMALLYPDAAYRARVVAETQRGGAADGREWELTCKDGSSRVVRWYNISERVPIPSWHAWAVGVDVTDRRRAKLALQRSGEQYRSTIDALSDAIHVVDAELRITLVNPALTEWSEGLGFGPPFVGLTPFDVWPFLPERVRCEYRRVFAEGEVLASEEVSDIHGREVVTETRKIPIVEGDRVVRVMTVMRDITEREQAEAAVRESEQRFRSVVQSSPMGMLMYRLDPDGRLVLEGANPAAEAILGIPCAPLVGRTIEQAFPKLADTEVPARHRAAAADGRDWHTDELAYADERFSGIYEIHAFQTSPGHVAAMFRDISDRKRVEAEVARLARFPSEAPSPVMRASDDGVLLYANHSSLPLLNAWGTRAGRRLPKAVREAVAEALHAGQATEIEVEAGEQTYALTLAPVTESGYVNLYGKDLTERKRAEAERRQLEAQIQQAQKLESLGVLAGGIAHDFNNLLAGILGHADLALGELRPESPARDCLLQVIAGSKRAADLTRQMLAYSGSGALNVQPIDLSRLVEEMGHLLEVSISKKVVLNYRLADSLPAVSADPTQVRQVVMNLITNASEAIGDRDGVVSITTGTQRCDRDYLKGTYLDDDLPEACYVYLEVADTGAGMSPETQARMFEPFFTSKFTGRGLGLAAVLGIVRGHGGAIRVYSEIGRGTAIKILFPRADGEPGPEPADEPADETWTGSGTVLLVDDEADVRSMAARMLEAMGFAVITAADGREGVEEYRRHAGEIVAVLLDLTMPRMDGEEAYRELRAIRPGVRVILSSGYGEQQATERFAGKGIAGFIQKPYRLDTLRRTLKRAFRGGS